MTNAAPTEIEMKQRTEEDQELTEAELEAVTGGVIDRAGPGTEGS